MEKSKNFVAVVFVIDWKCICNDNAIAIVPATENQEKKKWINGTGNMQLNDSKKKKNQEEAENKRLSNCQRL